MKIEVRHSCEDFSTYRAARTKSLFNVDSGANISIDADLPLDEQDWQIGVVVGPSGSGKTSIGHELVTAGYEWGHQHQWGGGPIVDEIAPAGDFDDVTGALAGVGLGDVPSWLRPFHVLSNGEQFRANLARTLAEQSEHPNVVIDEFSSVVDRQIACIGSMAFTKSWRRAGGHAVLLTCHHDVLEWIDPDWIYDTADDEFRWARGSLQRPSIQLDVTQEGWSLWPYFEPHHYLKAGPMPFGTAFVGWVDGEPVAHLGMSGKVSGKGNREARACRMVVMPEWQGAGIGMRFLNSLCERELRGDGFIGTPTTTQFHTAHPALVKALKRDRHWRQLSAHLHGGNKKASNRQARRYGKISGRAGWGGHFRAVTGWRYYGQRGVDAAQ